MVDLGHLSAEHFAQLAGIEGRRARRALSRAHNEGKPWRGHHLIVRTVAGRGGTAGQQYEVRVDSLPPEYQVRAQELLADAPPSEPRTASDGLADWKLSIIQPIRQQTAPHSRERAEMIAATAASVRYAHGKKRGQLVAATSLYEWIARYEAKGMAALMRKGRNDAGARRVVLSREWDALAARLNLSLPERERMAEAIRHRIASQWRSGVPSWPTAQMNVRPFVVEQMRAAGCDASDEELLSAATLPRKVLAESRAFRAVHIRRKNAGQSAATQTPRIRRDRSKLLPMDCVAGDVHHADIAFPRDDGSLCTIKMVAWLDLATNRAFITPFVLPKGQMIRREHVIQSFVEMCQHPSWGVPKSLYVDRGGEFNWGEFVRDLTELRCQIEVRGWDDANHEFGGADITPGMRKARPYNPQAKIIESLFSMLARMVFAQIAGYIGGDRMRKKTENQGRPPTPYPHDFEAFGQSLMVALDYYHAKPQSGHLRGKSPVERFGEFVAMSWGSVTLDAAELVVAFSTEKRCDVHKGGEIKFGGEVYRLDALIWMGSVSKVIVRAPLFGDRRQLFVLSLDRKPLGIATPAPVYPFGDPEGAKEQGRQTAILNRQIKEREEETDAIDLEQSMREAVAILPPQPVAPVLGIASINPEHREMARMLKDRPAAPDTDPASDGYEQTRARSRDRLVSLMQKVARTGG